MERDGKSLPSASVKDNSTRSHCLSLYDVPSADLFNKISASCFEKCASYRHREPDLALGEMSCTDRCVSKYLEAQQRVGAVLQEANEQQMAQQQNMAQMQQSLG